MNVSIRPACPLSAGIALLAGGMGVYAAGGRPMLFGSMMLWALGLLLLLVALALVLPAAQGGLLLRILAGAAAAALLAAAALEAVVLVNSRSDVTGEPETMVVLGANLWDHQPSPVLEARLEGAAEYLLAHPDMMVVVTGGMGDNEPVSEASCMAFYLEARGVEQQRILLEEQATNTFENLKFTKALLEQRGICTDNLLVVSNSAHLARVKLLARRNGLHISTLSVPLPGGVGYKAYFYLREGAALVKSFLMDRG